MAEYCGTSQMMISDYESGARKPGIEFLGKQAECFQVPISVFLGGNEETVGKELTQEKKESLVMRVTEVAESGAFDVDDWLAIYNICLEACHRKQVELMEQYLINCIAESDKED